MTSETQTDSKTKQQHLIGLAESVRGLAEGCAIDMLLAAAEAGETEYTLNHKELIAAGANRIHETLGCDVPEQVKAEIIKLTTALIANESGLNEWTAGLISTNLDDLHIIARGK